MKVVSIMGTRPEMIKMWSVLRRLDALAHQHTMVHTGQNYTPELKEFFFRDLELRRPDVEFNVPVTSYGLEVAQIIERSHELFVRTRPDAVLVLGDTHSGLAVLAAADLGIKIFHMEAGLRAWDKRMPEQRNRILIDHIADVLLPFNHYHRENLLRENIHPSKIFVTGNPTFDVMRHFQARIQASPILERLGLARGEYIPVTLHRRENVDDPSTLQSILHGLSLVQEQFDKTVLFAVHPRTRSRLSGAALPRNIRIIDPLGFYDFNKLSMHAWCLMGDSGTTPEESLFYKVPCVSLRQTTERYETIEAGAHIVAGYDSEHILEAVRIVTQLPWSASYDFGENHDASHIVINAMASHIKNYF